MFCYVYRPLMEFVNNGVNVNLLFFSFEMSAEVLLAKLLSLYIFETNNEIITYEEILSLTDTISEDKYKLVCDAKSWLETIEERMTIIDTPITPIQMDVTIREWNAKFGRFVDLDNDQEAYIPADKDAYNIVVVDHVKLAKDNGKGVKATIDEEANVAIYYRNKCQNTFILVQQINRNSKSMDRRLNNYQLLQQDDLSDSSGTGQASEIIIGLFNAHREKLGKLDGYNFKNLGDRARIWQCMKNRYGQSDKNVAMAFYGEIGYFRELPDPDDIDDYEKLTNLKTSSPKEEKKEEVKIDFGFTL
jgi:DnaB-like helicase C terminal domain